MRQESNVVPVITSKINSLEGQGTHLRVEAIPPIDIVVFPHATRVNTSGMDLSLVGKSTILEPAHHIQVDNQRGRTILQVEPSGRLLFEYAPSGKKVVDLEDPNVLKNLSSGQILTEVRKQLCFTQQDVANIIDISLSTFISWEKRKGKKLAVPQRHAHMKALGLIPDDVLWTVLEDKFMQEQDARKNR